VVLAGDMISTMASPGMNCPRCEALHPFLPRRREIGVNRVEVFIRCITCGHEWVLRESTVELERLHKLERRWKGRARSLLKRMGTVDSTTASQLHNIRARIKVLEDEFANRPD
jgi:Zn ribbon nucleic-acid-binding protein